MRERPHLHQAHEPVEAQLLKELDATHWKLQDLQADLAALRARDGSKSAARQAEKVEQEIARVQKSMEALLEKERSHLDAAAPTND